MFEGLRLALPLPLGSLRAGVKRLDADKFSRHAADNDLPCPWCQAPTRESDQRCPACGRRFG